MAPPRGLLPVLLSALALAAVPSQAAPPPDAFCVVLIEGFDGMRLVRVTVDEETNLTQREQLFAALDTTGDGVVESRENDPFMRDTLEVGEGQFANRTHALMAWATTNGSSESRFPLHHAVWRQVGHTFHKQNHTQPWPVREAADLETQQVRDAALDIPASAQAVTIEGGDRSRLVPVAVVEYVVVRAPPGWVVLSADGYDYTGWTSRTFNETEVDLPAFDTKRPFAITFERRDTPPHAVTTTQTVTQTVAPEAGPDGSRGTPALAPAVLAMALAAAAAVALRRRL